MVLPEAAPGLSSPPTGPPFPPALSGSRTGRTGRTRRTRRAGIVLGLAGGLLAVKLVAGGLGWWSSGSYEFLQTQGSDPVTWNHCHAIRYQVNPKGAPAGWQEIVARAVGEVERASGFVFADRGTTTKTNLIGQRYPGNEWEPVLIVWSDRYQDGSLDGGVIGVGGGGVVDVNGRLRYVVGKVALDTNVRDPHATQLVLEHELGHVLGLDHTSDSSQLMYAGYHGQDGFGDGDVNGLHRLHDVPCD